MIIVLGSRKGGVGKSTLACNLAVMFQRKGIKAALVDGDPLGSSSDWANAREDLEGYPSVPLIVVKPGKAMMKTIRDAAGTYEHVIVDLAGVSHEDNNLVLGLADMVISPFKPSTLDLNSLGALDELLSKFQVIRPDLLVRYVIVDVPHNIPSELAESRAYFAALGITPMESVTYHRKAWRKSMGMGLGVIETDPEKAGMEMERIFTELFQSQIYDEAHIN
jgi:chromosome partitioning protein